MSTTTDPGSAVWTGRGARLVVGIGELAVSQTPDDVIVTHALGSCIAVCVWDPVAASAGCSTSCSPKRS